MLTGITTIAGVCYIYLGCHYLMAPRPANEGPLHYVAHRALGLALLVIGSAYILGGFNH